MPRDLESTIDIAAAPDRVWAVMGDPRRLPEYSPQCRKTLLLGGPKMGGLMINLNRDGMKWWPTFAKIERYEPNKAVAFRMTQNHTLWSFELTPSGDGTTVVQRRTVDMPFPRWLSKAIDVLFGSETQFEHNLESGMGATLAKIKATAEG